MYNEHYTTNRRANFNKYLRWSLFWVAFLIFSDTYAQTCPTPFVQYPKMGVNAQLYFIDLAFNARYKWGSYDKPYDESAVMDADGWPTTDAANYFVEGASVQPGVYNLEFECNNPSGVTIDRFVTAFTVSNRTVTGNRVRAQLTIPFNTTSKEFTIRFGNTIGGVRKVRLLLPGYELDTDVIIDPRYLDLLAPFSNFRFHDAIHASGNSDTEWSQRTLPGQGGQANRSNGVAYEYMIELCNKANKDMWLNVPVKASDDYIRNLAKLVKDKLASNLVVHLELGNEIWNNGGGFWGLNYMIEGVQQDFASGTVDQKTIFGGKFGIQTETGNATAPNGAGFGAWSAVQYRIARRTKDIIEIFGEVFGANEINKKIRGMLCGQIGYGGRGHGFNIGPGLEYINAYYGDPSKYFYAIGVAPYYGGGPTNDMSVNQIIDLANKDVDCRYEKIPTSACQPTYDTGNQLESMIAKAKSYNLKLYAYEGAPDMDYNTGFGGPASPKSLALKDPRMKEVAIKFWKNWFSWCGPDALFNYYSGGISKDFTWIYALVEDITNSTNAPTFAGVKQVLSEPAPLLTGGHQIFTTPTVTNFRAVEIAGYNVNASTQPGLMYNRTGVYYDFLISVNQNGKYALSWEYSGSGTANILIDGKIIQNFTFPNSDAKKFSIPLELDLYYGVHALTIQFTGVPMGPFVNLHNVRFEYKNSKYPPKAPDAILAFQANVCLASNNQKYDVKTIDPSACYYKWVLPASATFTGDNTPNIVVDWKNTPVGNHYVKLVAGNDDGWSDTTRQEIKISNCGIDVSNLRPCLGEAVTFTDVTLNSTSWEWDFGFQSSPKISNLKVPPVVSYGPLNGSKTITMKVKEGGVDKIYSKLITVVYCNRPLVAPVSYCLNQVAAPLAATASNGGTNFKWYRNDTGGSSIPIPTPSTTAVGTTSYYVSQENGGVESSRAKLDVTVKANLDRPSLAVIDPVCLNAASTPNDLISKVSASTGALLKWYPTLTSTTSSASPTAPNTTAEGESSWYVTQSLGSCESPRAELKVSVKSGPQFTVEDTDPITCSQKGKLTFKGLTAATKYTVSYNTPSITADSTTNANGEIVLNLPQGIYNNFKVTKDGCSTIVSTPDTLTEPESPTYNVAAIQPLECGAQGALTFTTLKFNTTYQISYNSVAAQPYATQANGAIRINLSKGPYNNIKVSQGNCTTGNNTTYEILDKDLIAPIEQTGPSTYCQRQVVNISDLTNRVKSDPAYTLKWYTAPGGTPTSQPDSINTSTAGNKEIYVSQANAAGCESLKLKLTVVVNASSALSVTPRDPSACGVVDGKIIVSGLQKLIKNYSIEYKKEGQSQTVRTDFSDPEGVLTLNNLRSGKYSSITVTSVEGLGCLTNSTKEIILADPSAPTMPPTLGPNRQYCADEPIQSLTATANSGGTIEWYDNATTSGTPISNSANYTPDSVTGTQTFYAVEDRVGCKSQPASVSITIVPNPTVQIIIGTGGPASCNGTGYPLTLKSSELGVDYQFFKDNVAVGNAQRGTGASFTFATLSEKGVYMIKAMTAINNCQAQVTGTLTITNLVNPNQFTVSGNATGCEGVAPKAKILLSGSEPNVTYILNPSGKAMEGTGSGIEYEMEALKVNNGTYTVSAINNQNGCMADMLANATIAVQSSVGTPVLTADSVYCNNGSNTPKLIVSNATIQTWSISPATAGNIDATTGAITWLDTYTGPVNVSVEVSNAACSATTQSTSVATRTEAIPVIGFIQGDSLVCRGTEAMYQALPKSNVIYNWSAAGNVSIFENDQANGIITLKYNDDPEKEGVEIKVFPLSTVCGIGLPITKQIGKDPSCDLFVPNILTVKDKGTSTGWQIEGVENYPKMTIQIYNRWGAEVHKHAGMYVKPWDGSTANGSPLPTATYYYVLDKQDGSAKITGSVTVVRD